MASIRKRGNKWQVQVRRKGCADQSRSFNNKADAQAWARHIETLADRNGLPVNAKVLEQTSLTDLLTRYRDEGVPLKRGREIETVIIKAFLRHKLAKTRLSELTASDFAAYRGQRLKTVKPATINRELGVNSHCINVAMKEWSIPLSTNPLTEIRKPKLANRRERRLLGGEWTKLLQSAEKCRNPYIKPIMQLALETGMRRGEILVIEWGHIDWRAKTLHIPITKHGHARTIHPTVDRRNWFT